MDAGITAFEHEFCDKSNLASILALCDQNSVAGSEGALEVLVLGPVELWDLDDVGVDDTVCVLDVASVASGGEQRTDLVLFTSAELFLLEVDSLLLPARNDLVAGSPFLCVVDLALLLCGTAQSLALGGYPSLDHLLHLERVWLGVDKVGVGKVESTRGSMNLRPNAVSSDAGCTPSAGCYLVVSRAFENLYQKFKR